LPVFVGSAWGYGMAGAFDEIAFALALLAIACVHAAVNVLNDVYDDLNGTDRINDDRIFPFTGGSRFIQNDVINLEQMRRWGWGLLGFGAVFGVFLWMHAGAGVLVFGLVGIALGVAYSAPPLKLASRGMGESAVGVGLGILPVTGAAWLQTGVIDASSVLIAIPVSMWVANILLINEVPDARADSVSGKRTLVVRMGNKGTALLYFLWNLAAFLAVVGAVTAGFLPWWAAVLPALLMVLATKNTRNIAQLKDNVHALKPAVEITLMIHAVGSLWLAFCSWW
jgi:1,4-dihydroxy-2-naphthoate octaprenyltransferase